MHLTKTGKLNRKCVATGKTSRARRCTRWAVLAAMLTAVGVILVGPVSEASANNEGGDNYMHKVWATCMYHSISLNIQASGTFNGQVVSTRVWARVPNGTWQLVTNWRNTTINPLQTVNAFFGNTYGQPVIVDLYPQDLTTDGGYREISVEYYWWNGSSWIGHDFFTPSYIQAVLPSIYTVNYYVGPSATCLT